MTDRAPARDRGWASEDKELRAFVRAHADWNDGAGLIVPSTIASELRRRGIFEGYTEQQPILEKTEKP